MTPTEAAPAFFLAVAVILVVCRGVCMVAVRLGQPPVVGEMIAGVLLGPSLLGLVLPAVQTGLFPDGVRPLLYVGGQIGLVIYMFGAGYEFSLRSIRGSVKSVGAISAAGTVVPLALGVGVAVFGSSWAGIGKDGVSLVTSAAFVGVALAITAFPMLARIITERGLGGTRFGSLALACGASTTFWRGSCWPSCSACTPTRPGRWPSPSAAGCCSRCCWCSSGAGCSRRRWAATGSPPTRRC